MPSTTDSTESRTPGQPLDRCPYCNGWLFAVPQVKGPFHFKQVCLDCGRSARNLIRPWNRERAEQFTLYFGRHRRETVGSLARTAEGESYLRWVARTFTNNVAKAARIVLGIEEAEAP
jgi:hypothetical protein